jgi:hypothetical protein
VVDRRAVVVVRRFGSEISGQVGRVVRLRDAIQPAGEDDAGDIGHGLMDLWMKQEGRDVGGAGGLAEHEQLVGIATMAADVGRGSRQRRSDVFGA